MGAPLNGDVYVAAPMASVGERRGQEDAGGASWWGGEVSFRQQGAGAPLRPSRQAPGLLGVWALGTSWGTVRGSDTR